MSECLTFVQANAYIANALPLYKFIVLGLLGLQPNSFGFGLQRVTLQYHIKIG